MTIRLLIILLLGSIAAIGSALYNPVNSSSLRILFVFGICGTFMTLFAMGRKSKGAKVLLSIITLLVVSPLLLPSRKINAKEIREDYLRRLVQLDKVPYHWGGESGSGIDCSGLPRKTLREALFWSGLRTGNGKPIRSAVSQWWNDASALAISEGYRGYATRLKTRGTIAQMSYNDLEPGDLAVSVGGAHVLVFLGGKKWIQAAPEVGRVAIFDGRKGDNRWLTIPVTTHRWTVFE